MKISDIRLNKNNPRKIDNDKFEKLKKSIEEFPKMMELRPIIVDNTNTILGGNMRYKALQSLGYKEIPDNWVKQADKLTAEEKQRFIIADNVAFGEHDWEVLANDWDTEMLEDWGIDLPVDFSLDEDKAEAKEDNFEIHDEIETDIVLGDLIEIGEHRLICGDSTDVHQIKNLMNGKKCDMIFTDPPFDFDFDFDFDLCNGHIFYMNSEKNLIKFTIKHIDYFSRLYTIDFRNAHLISNKAPLSRCDYVAEFLVGKNKFNNKKDAFSTLIESSKGIFQKDSHLHTQMKKTSLPANFISHFSKDNELILDFFLGAGSTMLAAHQLNRKCYGIEIKPKYCQVIVDRMIKLDNTLRIKINGKIYNKNKN